MFEGFSDETVATSGATIHLRRKGEGPPLLLLHGYPQSHVTWHKVAGALAETFSVVVPDLRGYGESSKPPGGERHHAYSFRAMATDQLETMRALGHQRFFVAAHDRGARVAHRLCLDHPEHVRRACLLDIAPTLTMYEGTNQEFATRYVWWFFLLQPAPIPERMIGLDPKSFLEESLRVLSGTPGAVTSEAMVAYLRAFARPETIHALCEDYRASADLDLEMDRADDVAGRKVQCPVHLLWGTRGTVGKMWNVPAAWKDKVAGPLSGRALDCGHLLPEERPDEVIAELRAFFYDDAA